MLIKRVKREAKPCLDCAFKTVQSCFKIERCNRYIPITPNCSNCARKEDCINAYVVVHCGKWEPDSNSPFLSLVKELSDLKNTVSSKAHALIDDSDFKLAPNFLEFCLSYLNITPYPKQIEEASRFFNDICWHCSNPKYENLFDESLGDILDNIVFLEYGVCPKCKRNRFQIIKEYPEKSQWFNEFVGVAGQRSGKSRLATMISAYVWHWYFKLGNNPSKFYGLLDESLNFTLIGLTYGQAIRNLWTAFSRYIRESSWFSDLHKMINTRCKELGIDDAVKFPDSFIVYKHKNMECSPMGPDKRILRGPTRPLVVIDELGWFTGTKAAIKINPDEVYTALSNSLGTIRTHFFLLKKARKLFHIPTGYAISISSPSSARDKIMRLLYLSRKAKSIYAFHLPTWEMNPFWGRHTQQMQNEFDTNPNVMRDFGAFPPLAESPFIAELSPIHEVAIQKKNFFNYKLVMIQSKSRKKYVSIRMNKMEPSGKPLLIGVDAGRNGNAFAIVATSYNSSGQLTLEGAIEVKPLPDLPVNFSDVYKHALKPILETQQVVALLVDQWQSIDLIDKVDENYGDRTDAIRYSLRYSDFELARQRLLGESVVLPKPEVKDWSKILKGVEDYEEFFVGRPISHLYLQLATVQDSGRRVEKSGDLDDDLFRALMLCVHFTFDEKDGYKYKLLTYGDSALVNNKFIGITKGRSIDTSMSKRNHSTFKNSIGNITNRSGSPLPSPQAIRQMRK